MDEKIQRKIFGKNTFKNTIDTEFNQLVPKTQSIAEKESASVDSFFNDYDALFYDIPTTGTEKSHLELVNRSSEHLGISFQDLQAEIEELRRENVALRNQLFTITQANQ